MARPKKQTVSYFPHQCTSGKTLFIIEQEYGNDGYAFWFKLLEMLGATPGHYLDYNDVAVKRFIAAKTRVSAAKTELLLQLLAELDAIDQELWSEGKIWSQNFIDNIYNASGIRRTEKPQRPGKFSNNEAKGELLQQKPPNNEVIDDKHVVNAKKKGERERERERERETKIAETGRIEEIIKQLEKKHNIIIAATDKNFYMFLVVEMAKIFTEENPEYFFDKEADYSACLQIAYNIAQMKKWSKAEVLNGKMSETLSSWKIIVPFIKADKWLRTRSLTDISTITEWQRLVQKMKNPDKDGKVNSADIGKEFIPD